MKAFILAGGLGTRLRSLVSDRPKPLADVGGRPFLEYQIDLLKRHKINDVVLCTGYLSEHIERHFGDGAAWGVSIEYSREDEPLGTGGALRLAAGLAGEAFLVLNGDTHFDIDIGRLLRFHHVRRRADPRGMGTVALTTVPDASCYGQVTLDGAGRVLGFAEKATRAGPGRINAGVYVLQRNIFQYIPAARRVSLERETFPTLLGDGMQLYGYPAAGFFVDMGTPEGYQTLQRYVRKRQPC